MFFCKLVCPQFNPKSATTESVRATVATLKVLARNSSSMSANVASTAAAVLVALSHTDPTKVAVSDRFYLLSFCRDWSFESTCNFGQVLMLCKYTVLPFIRYVTSHLVTHVSSPIYDHPNALSFNLKVMIRDRVQP